MKKVPEIRFNGFKGDWTVKLLDDIFRKVTDKNTDNALVETFTNSAQDGIVSQRDFFNHDISNSENIHGYYVVRPDDFVYNPRMSVTAPVGPINRNRLGRAGVMSPLYTVFKAKNSNYNLGFVEYFFKTDKWHSFMWKNGDNGARGDRFSIRDEILKLMPITLPPSNKEQSDISTFFDNLDEYISSQALELQKLKNIKKACLEKMFPKEGELVPEIRFDGFEGNWEKKPAKKLFSLYSDKGYPSLPVLSASQEEGMILRNDVGFNMSYNKENIISYKRVRPGQFVIHLRSFQGGFAHSDLEGITSPAYTIFGLRDVDNHDDHFWGIYFTSKSFIKRLEKVTYGIRDGRSISVDGFMNLDMTYPSTKEEQSNIAKFFSRLDVHIKAMSDKLDKL